jgi:hypothetical protein
MTIIRRIRHNYLIELEEELVETFLPWRLHPSLSSVGGVHLGVSEGWSWPAIFIFSLEMGSLRLIADSPVSFTRSNHLEPSLIRIFPKPSLKNIYKFLKYKWKQESWGVVTCVDNATTSSLFTFFCKHWAV